MGEGNVIPTQAYPPSNDAPAYHTDDTPGGLPFPTAEPTAGAVSVRPSSCEPPNEEDNDAEWGFPEYLAGPALADAFTLDVARQQCQAKASACGFNIVQKSADRKVSKATFPSLLFLCSLPPSIILFLCSLPPFPCLFMHSLPPSLPPVFALAAPFPPQFHAFLFPFLSLFSALAAPFPLSFLRLLPPFPCVFMHSLPSSLSCCFPVFCTSALFCTRRPLLLPLQQGRKGGSEGKS